MSDANDGGPALLAFSTTITCPVCGQKVISHDFGACVAAAIEKLASRIAALEPKTPPPEETPPRREALGEFAGKYFKIRAYASAWALSKEHDEAAMQKVLLTLIDDERKRAAQIIKQEVGFAGSHTDRILDRLRNDP